MECFIHPSLSTEKAIPLRDCSDVAVGDVVIRMLAGVVPHALRVSDIKDGLIYCGDWTFDVATGIEVDDVLHYGPKYGHSGSYISEIMKLEKD